MEVTSLKGFTGPVQIQLLNDIVFKFSGIQQHFLLEGVTSWNMFAGCIGFRECLLQYQLQFHDSDLGMLSGFTICKPIVWSTWSTCTLPHENPIMATAGYFPATAPAPEDLQDQQLQAYLKSFSPDPPQALEPGWAKAIRLLEAAPVSRRSSEPVQPRATEAVKAWVSLCFSVEVVILFEFPKIEILRCLCWVVFL